MNISHPNNPSSIQYKTNAYWPMQMWMLGVNHQTELKDPVGELAKGLEEPRGIATL